MTPSDLSDLEFTPRPSAEAFLDKSLARAAALIESQTHAATEAGNPPTALLTALQSQKDYLQMLNSHL